MELSTKYLTHHWHYTTGASWASILSSGFLKSRQLLIAENLRARDELKHDREALLRALPPYMKARHSPLRRKGTIAFSRQIYFEPQAGILTEVKLPNRPWSRREDEKEELLVVGMKNLFERGNGLIRIGISNKLTLSWEKLLDEAGVGWLEKMELRAIDAGNDHYNEKYVTGIVADKIPLGAASCVEVCVPSPDGSTCVWMPFLHPRAGSAIDVDDTNRAMLEASAAATDQMKALVDRGKNIAVALGHVWSTGKELFREENQYETTVYGFAV